MCYNILHTNEMCINRELSKVSCDSKVEHQGAIMETVIEERSCCVKFW